MFEHAELPHSIEKQDYNKRAETLREDLLAAQHAAMDQATFPVVVLINGVDGAGKGDTVNMLYQWLDARFMHACGFGTPTPEEKTRPPYWRFWQALPPKGRIALFFGSWYTQPILDHAYGNRSDEQLEVDLSRVRAFERMLTDAGALVIKFWFHMSKAEQRKRLKRLEKDKATKWRVTKTDWQHHKLYDTFVPLCAHVLQSTSTGSSPWIIVPGADKRYREVFVAEQILSRLQAHLKQGAKGDDKPTPLPPSPNVMTVLDKLDLTKALDKDTYDKQLEALQGRLNGLSRKLGKKRRGVVMVFEGWDAAGKGGAIRRLIAGLDARQYRIVPIGAPSAEERRFPYLWRFWRRLPRLGQITMFDRSWYGRVLVERVEGFATEAEWARAFKEINNFENQLVDHGYILVKIWVHISEDEQLRRFKEREKTPWKQHKIGPEDYRNRKQWNNYEQAVADTMERTSTPRAPWNLVEGNDKRYARIKVLETVCDRLEEALGNKKKA